MAWRTIRIHFCYYALISFSVVGHCPDLPLVYVNGIFPVCVSSSVSTWGVHSRAHAHGILSWK